MHPDQEEVPTTALLADQLSIDPEDAQQDIEVQVVRPATGTQTEHLHTEVQEAVLPVQGVQDTGAQEETPEVQDSAEALVVVHVVQDSAGVQEVVHVVQEVCEALVVLPVLPVEEGLLEEVVEAAEEINHPNIIIS